MKWQIGAYSSWSGAAKSTIDVINDGTTQTGTQSYSGKTITITFNDIDKGWRFKDGLLFGGDKLFYKGDYEKKQEDVYGDIYYCFRTKDGGTVPLNYSNGNTEEKPIKLFLDLYFHSHVAVYAGSKAQTPSVSVNITKLFPTSTGTDETVYGSETIAELLDRAGYRCVGCAKVEGEYGITPIEKWNDKYAKKDPREITVNLSFKYTKSCAIVTFFVEPIKGYYGHAWKSSVEGSNEEQLLNIINSGDPAEGDEILFPNYYDTTEKKCTLKVKSLNKFWWPGFILTDALVVKTDAPPELGKSGDNVASKSATDRVWENAYDENSTTQYVPGESGKYTVGESFYACYGNEETGLASDKQFWFMYRTPQIQIEHVKYKTNSDGTYEPMRDVSGKPIVGTTQILHQYAYIESLITDNIGTPHTITIGNNTFNYKCPEYNFVQLQISEISSSENRKVATLYSGDEYKNGENPRDIEEYGGYTGNFERYFSVTYSDLANYAGFEELKNTNKSWKLVFKYDEKAPEIHIRYKVIGGGTIFLKDANGNYMSEIVSSLKGLSSYSHEVRNVGDNYTVESYTISGDGYDENTYKTATKTGENIEVSGDTISKDVYILVLCRAKTEVTTNEPVTIEKNREIVHLGANTSDNEEYDIEKLVTTSEDLYISGDIYDYKFEADIGTVSKQKTVKVKIAQNYIYKKHTDKNGNVTEERKTLTTDDYINLTLDYNIFEIKKAELYDLKDMHLYNEALKYYEGYDGKNPPDDDNDYYTKDITLQVHREKAYIDYESAGEPATSPTVTDKDSFGQVYGLKFDRTVDGVEYWTYTVKDLSYVEPKEEDLKKKINEALATFEANTKVKVQKLQICISGDTKKEPVKILSGGEYTLNEKSTALKEGNGHYTPYVQDRATLYTIVDENGNRTISKGLYVMEQAENKKYPSTFWGNYYLTQFIKSGDPGNEEIIKDDDVATYYDKVYRTYAPDIKAIESTNVYTPIINATKLKPSEDNKKANQLDRTDVATTTTILTLNQSFTITIPNGGTTSSEKGYTDNKTNVNALGLLNKDKDRDYFINMKSEDKIYTASDYTNESEEKWNGPAYAEYKLIKFPYDVYLQRTAGPVLFKAGEWYNLYEYLTASTENYEFAVPVWVKDNKAYEGADGIQVLIVAENCPTSTLNDAKADPMNNVKTGVSYNSSKEYILRKTYNTFISGNVYGLQVRDTDDPGYMGKLKSASTPDLPLIVSDLPLAQKGQVANYNYGLKLGYRFYFDLKTRGQANTNVSITPKIYYVSADGKTVTDNITLFYNTKTNLYTRLLDSDLSIRMNMTTTHGNVKNSEYTSETTTAKNLNTSRIFTNAIEIGKILNGIVLNKDITRLPYNNIAETAKACGFGTNTTEFVTSSGKTENYIKDMSGHWYGEFYLPASTNVVVGNTDATKQQAVSGSAKSGYLIVTFEEIKTGEDSDDGYLSYAKPDYENSKIRPMWQQEGKKLDASGSQIVKLPNANGTEVHIPTSGTCMAIYQVGLRANNDFEQTGSH